MRVNEASEVKFLKGKDTELKDVTDVAAHVCGKVGNFIFISVLCENTCYLFHSSVST